MKTLQTIFLTTLLTFVLSGHSALARQKQAVAGPTGLALEIIFHKGVPPAYHSVPPSNSKLSGAWFARFRRVHNWQQPEGTLPVRAVNIVSRKEGEAVRVNVSVFLGVKFHEKEEQVATYLVQENEKVTTNELARVGVEPFEITVVKVPQLVPEIPSIINRTESIVIEGIEPNNSTLPSYTLSLRNISSKNVVALQIDVLVDGKAKLLSQPSGKEGLPLIRAGGDFQTNVHAAREVMMTRHGYTPNSPRGQSLLIGTAVFEDGSYEGDAQMAAQMKARIMAQRLQLKQIVVILSNLTEIDELKENATLETLKQQVSTLKDDVDMAVVEGLLAEFPNVDLPKNDLRISFQVVMHRVKKDFLEEIGRFEKAYKESPGRNDFKVWTVAVKEKYSQWLSRL